MEYISSDTNVWLDFSLIDRLDLPFLLPYIYLMNNDAIEDELLSPPGLNKRLIDLGLKKAELSEEEFYLAIEYSRRFKKPSRYDCVALAIAKIRGITLLTGDGPLRKAAISEGVSVMGTIGILDQLLSENLISTSVYVECFKAFDDLNGGKIRLPKAEIQNRIKKFDNTL